MTDQMKIFQPYYGKWGGFFVPDPMTPALDELSATAEQMLNNDTLKKQIEDLVKELSSKDTGIKPVAKSKNIYTTNSDVRWYAAAGYAVLAKASGRELACGVANAEEAKILSTVSKKLGLPVSMWLNVSTGSDEKLVEELTAAGITLNVKQCRELFDDPDMYAFQKFIGNPAKYLWAPVHTHAGPHPFVSLTGYFSRLAAEKLIREVSDELKGQKVSYALPAYPGIAVAGFISLHQNNPLSLLSYEPKADIEKEECYLGTYTKVKLIGKKDFVLSPVLVNAWETGAVKQLETTSPIETLEKTDPAMTFVVIEE
jgi:tryptophan synthase beta subunit